MYFPDIERKKNPPLVESFPAKLSKLLSLCPWEHFAGKHFFRLNSLFSVIFWHWAKKLSSFVKSFSTELKELIFWVSLKSFEKNLEIKVLIFQSILHLNKIFSDFWQKHFCTMVKTSFYEATGTYWGKKYIVTFPFFHIFWTSIKSFGLLVKVFRPGYGICSLSVHRNHLNNSVSSEEVSCVFLCGKNPAFCFKFLNGVVKNACYVSVKTFWGEIFLF